MLAQLVEQRTFNPFVVGSTPAHPTIIFKKPCCLTHQGFFLAAWNSDPLSSRAGQRPILKRDAVISHPQWFERPPRRSVVTDII